MSQLWGNRPCCVTQYNFARAMSATVDLLSLVYPARCLVCTHPCTAGSAVCVLCRCQIERPLENEVLNSIREFFPDGPVDDAWALWVFEKGGSLQRIHQAIKYSNKPYFGSLLGRMLGHVVRRNAPRAFDAVVPIPLHRARLFERGYNQATPIASAVAEVIGVPFRPSLLRRAVATRTQTGLSANDRAANLAAAFAANQNAATLSILVVDDVITSGATMCAAASALRSAGARSVDACALGFARR